MNRNLPFSEWPDAEEIAAKTLDQRQQKLVSDFGRDGYVTLDLDIPDFGVIAERIIAQLKPKYNGDHRIQDAWRVSDDVRALACNHQILDTLALLYGRSAFPFQTLNFDVGTEQPTHSDSIHFHSFPHLFMAGVWVALEDTDAGNGPLHYYPGSHKLPPYTLADIGVPPDKAGSYDLYVKHYEPFIEEVVARHGFTRTHAHLRRGQALIWSANLLHGGSPIREQGRTRHSQVTHYYFDDCVYYTPLWSDAAAGKNYYRSPLHIGTGRTAPQRNCGQPFKPPLKMRTKEFLKSAVSRIYRSKR
ncbi:MAG TPA: phytanoyl-CoA dioxygenase family protein [Rhizomicrobium sp.]|nr:phytanoyl-CoA dioxygenase family protein [Rhizomicrobium sp.]